MLKMGSQCIPVLCSAAAISFIIIESARGWGLFTLLVTQSEILRKVIPVEAHRFQWA